MHCHVEAFTTIAGRERASAVVVTGAKEREELDHEQASSCR